MGITAKKIKKAAIYDPYLDTLGGGERYCLTVAEILLKNGYEVDIFWSGNQKIIEIAQQRFSLNLKNLKTIPDIFNIRPQQIDLIEGKQDFSKFITHSFSPLKLRHRLKIFIKKIKITRKYDLFFYLSDGSIPFLFSKANFLHVQVPFINNFKIKNIFSDFIKLKLISKVICNSKFTAKFQNFILKDKVAVLYPPVDLDKFKNSKEKENIILSVGRFDNILNAKKQDILIDAFKILCEDKNIKNWKLILVGGSINKPSENSYLKHLKEKAINLPIEFVINSDFDILQEIYSKSSVYWHAAGFGVDENINPQNTEHFGITIVEAMVSGLVPVVVSKGGIPEIIEDGVNGYLWDSINELVFKTEQLIENPNLMTNMSKQAIFTCQRFSKDSFEKQLLRIIQNKI